MVTKSKTKKCNISLLLYYMNVFAGKYRIEIVTKYIYFLITKVNTFLTIEGFYVID